MVTLTGSENDATFSFYCRYQQRSFVRMAGCIPTKSGTDITDLSAINDFFSCILFLIIILETVSVIFETALLLWRTK